MNPTAIVIGDPDTAEAIFTASPVVVESISSLDPINVNITGGLTKASLWTGEGPPHLIIGARVGDEYLDTISGTIYRLDPGE